MSCSTWWLICWWRFTAYRVLWVVSTVVAFAIGPGIVLAVGLTLLRTHAVAGTAMCCAGAALLVLGLGLSGHRTLVLVRVCAVRLFIKRVG